MSHISGETLLEVGIGVLDDAFKNLAVVNLAFGRIDRVSSVRASHVMPCFGEKVYAR